MTTLSRDIVVANCQARSATIAESLARTLGLQLQACRVSETETLATFVAGHGVPGLVAVSTVGSEAVVLAIPNHDQILPAWCADPDAAGQSRLAALGQELGSALLPDDLAAANCRAGWVQHVGQALQRCKFVDETALLLEAKVADGRKLQMLAVWPALDPAALLAEPADSERVPQSPVVPPDPPRRRITSLGDLPSYSRSLLKIKVPVVVTLASKRQPLGRIIELGPGSIIHFEKSCEEVLDLEVGGQSVAQGEPIKVGDKFGIRLTSLVMPTERFLALGKPTRPPVKSR